MGKKGWIGVDLDATLAAYSSWRGPTHIGPPIMPMLSRVKGWLAEGWEVRIFTARAGDPDPAVIPAIKAWCREHVGVELEVTNVKDYQMVELWDDRAVQVEKNTGEPLSFRPVSKCPECGSPVQRGEVCSRNECFLKAQNSGK